MATWELKASSAQWHGMVNRTADSIIAREEAIGSSAGSRNSIRPIARRK